VEKEEALLSLNLLSKVENDLDAYRILKSHLKNKNNLACLIELEEEKKEEL
jgi:hypothetical protein